MMIYLILLLLLYVSVKGSDFSTQANSDACSVGESKTFTVTADDLEDTKVMDQIEHFFREHLTKNVPGEHMKIETTITHHDSLASTTTFVDGVITSFNHGGATTSDGDSAAVLTYTPNEMSNDVPSATTLLLPGEMSSTSTGAMTFEYSPTPLTGKASSTSIDTQPYTMETTDDQKPLNRTGRCKIAVGENCYWIIHYMKDPKIDLSDASKICSNEGAIVTKIPTEETYAELVKYLRSEVIALDLCSGVCVWTGLIYDWKTNSVNGTNANLTSKWYPEHPKDQRPAICLRVSKDETDSNQGIKTKEPSDTVWGVVCQEKN